jgi:hypothetical protein
MTRTALLLACAVLLAMGACAKVGTLDRPAPLFGEKAKAKYRADQAAAAAAKTQKSDTTPEALPPPPDSSIPPPP